MATSPSRSGSSDRRPGRGPDGRAARPGRTAVPLTGSDVGDVVGRTFRSSGQTVICAVMMVLWPLILVAMALSWSRNPAAAVALVVIGLLGGFAYWRAYRMRLDVDDAAITVVGFTSTRRVPWADVVGVVASYEGLRVLVAEGRGPILHSISRSRRSVTTGQPGWADAVADRLTEEARTRQHDG